MLRERHSPSCSHPPSPFQSGFVSFLFDFLTRSCRQRAFRQRKEHYIKELEVKLLNVEDERDALISDNTTLRNALQQALSDNNLLLAGMQDLLTSSPKQLDAGGLPPIPNLDPSFFELGLDDDTAPQDGTVFIASPLDDVDADAL